MLRGDIVKDDSGSYAEFIGQGPSETQMTAAKIMDIISRLPGCDGRSHFNPLQSSRNLAVSSPEKEWNTRTIKTCRISRCLQMMLGMSATKGKFQWSRTKPLY